MYGMSEVIEGKYNALKEIKEKIKKWNVFHEFNTVSLEFNEVLRFHDEICEMIDKELNTI